MSIKEFREKLMSEKEFSINPNQLSYFGIFFDKSTICELATQGERLDKVINDPHITLAYRPSPDKFKEIMNFMKKHANDTITANITRYGNDGKNEGFFVESISCSDGSVIPYFGAEQKHITISVSNDSSPVKTGTMDFDQSIETIQLTGKIGAFMFDKTVQYAPETAEKTTTISELADNVLSDNGNTTPPSFTTEVDEKDIENEK